MRQRKKKIEMEVRDMHYLYRTLYPIVRKLLTGLLIKQLSQGSADIAGAARLGCAFSLWGMVGH